MPNKKYADFDAATSAADNDLLAISIVGGGTRKITKANFLGTALAAWAAISPSAKADAAHTHSGYASKVGSPTTGNFASLTAGGDLADSGSKASDFATAGHNHTGVYSAAGHDHAGIYDPAGSAAARMGKVAGATENNFASFDAAGQVKDSSSKAADFATAGHNHTGTYEPAFGIASWAGTTNVTTLGTIGTGTWNATEIAAAKLGLMTGDGGAGGARGAVPAPAAGDAAAGKFLSAGGAWAVPASFSWGATITGTAGDGVTITQGNNTADGVAGVKITQSNTQNANPVGLNIQIGTSALGMGALIQGTGSTTAGAAGTGKVHLCLWGDTSYNTNTLLSAGYGASYTECFALTGKSLLFKPMQNSGSSDVGIYFDFVTNGAAGSLSGAHFKLAATDKRNANNVAISFGNDNSRSNDAYGSAMNKDFFQVFETMRTKDGSVTHTANHAYFYHKSYKVSGSDTTTITGAVMKIENDYQQDAGTLTDQMDVLLLKNNSAAGATGNLIAGYNGTTAVFQMSKAGNMTFSADASAAQSIAVGTTNGLKIGTATNQKIGFFGATPVIQQAHLTDEKADYTTGDLDTEAEVIAAINATNLKLNALLARLETFGLSAAS